MRSIRCVIGALGVVGAVALADPARAADVAPVAPVAPSAVPAVPAAARAGLAVLALPGATDAAWPLAREVYGDPALRPAGIDDGHARVLCGEPAPASAPAELRDLADTVGAVRGDDAPSRALLAGIARNLSVRGVLVVRGPAGAEPPTASVFLADTGAYDAALYVPDAGTAPGAAVSWSAAGRSLARAYGAAVPALPASPEAAPPATAHPPALATHDAPRAEATSKSTPFYASPWFWGAIGAAVVGGGAAYLVSRDSSPSTIHLEVQVPR